METVQAIKAEFPIFSKHPDLVYLDSAATTQKPKVVIDAITQFYTSENANIHRGIYDLAAQTTQKYEAVRQKVAQLIQATTPKEIIYTSGTTAGINLVAQSFLAPKLVPGDEVIISTMEHHANLIPWQMVCQARGAILKVIPLSDDGSLDVTAFKELLSPRTKMVALVHVSNTLGIINPIRELIQIGKSHDPTLPFLVDCAQSIAYYPINVQQWDADFIVFSGHKLFGPTGIGVLYGKQSHLQQMAPIHFGGDMIRKVSFKESTFAPPPQRFEAGTTNIAGVIGLGAAIDFVQSLDKAWVKKHLTELRDYATEQLDTLPGLTHIGRSSNKTAILSFTLDQAHPHDIATFLGTEQIAIRAGHHCTQPLMNYYQIPATTRASCSIYNGRSDIDRLIRGLQNIITFFA